MSVLCRETVLNLPILNANTELHNVSASLKGKNVHIYLDTTIFMCVITHR